VHFREFGLPAAKMPGHSRFGPPVFRDRGGGDAESRFGRKENAERLSDLKPISDRVANGGEGEPRVAGAGEVRRGRFEERCVFRRGFPAVGHEVAAAQGLGLCDRRDLSDGGWPLGWFGSRVTRASVPEMGISPGGLRPSAGAVARLGRVFGGDRPGRGTSGRQEASTSALILAVMARFFGPKR